MSGFRSVCKILVASPASLLSRTEGSCLNLLDFPYSTLSDFTGLDRAALTALKHTVNKATLSVTRAAMGNIHQLSDVW